MGSVNGINKRGTARSGTMAALDIGSRKVCCFIAHIDAAGSSRVVGIGHQISEGLRGGAVVDLEATVAAITAAVAAAERMAEVNVKRVLVSFSCGDPASHTVGVEVPVSGHEISDADLRRVLAQGRPRAENGEREVAHAVPVGFRVDGASGVRDPRGMFGSRLGVDIHVVTAGVGAMRNLRICLERAHLDVEETLISSYASGLSVLDEDELNLGVTVIDMGGGTTSIAVFYEGDLHFADVVTLGGQHVTNDIARGLATPVAHAERMKTLYGTATAIPADESAMIDVPRVGETEQAEPNHVPRSVLSSIIQPRAEEILEFVRERLELSGYARTAGRRVVLTGGASQLTGMRELAARVLDKQVRMGRPVHIQGLAEATGGPAFATCAGLLCHAAQGRSALLEAAETAPRQGLARVGHWLRENF
jgi:cell division protein FtsA